MTTKDLIEEFFNEQFSNTSPFFLYKDKQMLNNGEFKEYAQRQISKAKKAFWSIAWALFFCSFYGITKFIEYGAEPNWFDLSLGIIVWVGLIVAILYHAKQYYTIKSAMELFLKMIDKEETNEQP
jgi:hypothetical protein